MKLNVYSKGKIAPGNPITDEADHGKPSTGRPILRKVQMIQSYLQFGIQGCPGDQSFASTNIHGMFAASKGLCLPDEGRASMTKVDARTLYGKAK